MKALKKVVIDDILSTINDSPFLIVIDYAGMKVAQFQELRKRLVATGATGATGIGATGATGGRSRLAHRMCGWCLATIIESMAPEPPTSVRVLYLLKSNF